MAMQLRPAERKQAKIRLGLSGASGFGKTYSGLLIASGLASAWDKIAVIDTENQSADLYSDLGAYNVLTLEPDFTPERYIAAIDACEKAGMEVIIIDSISHEWEGKGGCLELQERLGGRYQDWAKITPRHRTFLDKILHSPCHVITTVRRKQDYAMTTDERGRAKVEKQGTKEVTRDGFEYELTLSFELVNDRHMAKASKDRTGIFMGQPESVLSAETGRKIKEWCESGAEPITEPAAKAEAKVVSQPEKPHTAAQAEEIKRLAECPLFTPEEATKLLKAFGTKSESQAAAFIEKVKATIQEREAAINPVNA
jgi:hypothetical protein